MAHGEATGERFYLPELHRLRAEILFATAADVGAADATAATQQAVTLARSQASATLEARAQATFDLVTGGTS